jgi:hypothetical protein
MSVLYRVCHACKARLATVIAMALAAHWILDATIAALASAAVCH